jgi:pyruvate ferredoxin oxidoreductase gamma subunit
VVLDPTLLGSVPVTEGMKEGGILAINTKHDPAEVKEMLKVSGFVVAVDATNIAMEELGVPITNVVMLATLLKAEKLVELEVLEKFIAERFARIAEKEIKAFRRAYDEARVAQ